MRKIKFRAWDTEAKEMLSEPDELAFPFYAPGGQVEVAIEDILNFNPKRFLWMQFTGIVDWNGVEIFEGDIVKKLPAGDMEEFYGVVKFDERYRQYTCMESGINEDDVGLDSDVLSYENAYIEVIGNIYENINLLQ